MDFRKLSEVTMRLQGGKVVSTGVVHDSINMSQALNTIHKKPTRISDSHKKPTRMSDSQKPACKIVICDSDWVTRYKGASKEVKQRFMSRLSDSQKRRVLTYIKDDVATVLAYNELDKYMYLCITDFSDRTAEILKNYVETQHYTEFPQSIKTCVDKICKGDPSVPESVISLIEKQCGHSLVKSVASVLDEAVADAIHESLVEFDISKDYSRLCDSIQGLIRGNKSNAKAIMDSFNKQFMDFSSYTAPREELDALTEEVEQIVDDKELDALFEEGKSEGQSKSLMEEFIDALNEFKEGDSTKLTEFVNASDEPEDAPEEEPTEYEPEDAPEEEPTEDEPEDDVADSLKSVANAILAGKTPSKVLCDHLIDTYGVQELVPYSTQNPDNQPFTEETAVNVPLSYNEYCTLNQDIPEALIQEAQSCTDYPNSYKECTEDESGSYLQIDGVYYVPINCTPQEAIRKIEGSCDKAEAIKDNSVQLRALMKSAARLDNLHFLSTKFYKSKSITDSWTFQKDAVPSVLRNPKTTSIVRCPYNEKDILLYGYPYKYV